jgi:hypothetical protein
MEDELEHDVLHDLETYVITEFMYHWGLIKGEGAHIQMELRKGAEVVRLHFVGVDGLELEAGAEKPLNEFSQKIWDISHRGYEELTVMFEKREGGAHLVFYATSVERIC